MEKNVSIIINEFDAPFFKEQILVEWGAEHFTQANCQKKKINKFLRDCKYKYFLKS